MNNPNEAELRIGAAVDRVRTELNQLLSRRLPVEVTTVLIPLRGKFNRARLMLAFSDLGGTIGESALKLASGAELLHLASLIQDDLVDNSPYRQGVPALNRAVGAEAAILISDWLFGQAYQFFCQGKTAWLTQINQLLQAMALSELKQELAVAKRQLPTVLSCLRYNYQKTARFFQTCCRLGMAAGGSGNREALIAGKVGLWWGMAYQLGNDLQDLPLMAGGGDLVDQDRRRGLLTLPLVLLLLKIPGLKSEVLSLPAASLGELLQKYGIIQQCTRWYNRFLIKAEQELNRLTAATSALTWILIREWIKKMRLVNEVFPDNAKLNLK